MLCESDHSGERDDGRLIASTLNPFEKLDEVWIRSTSQHDPLNYKMKAE
jgi:hypothetical protein